MLPDGIELIHGPGCPVCVLPMGRVDCVALAHMPGMIFTTFGDAMRVPGSKKACSRPKPTAPTCAWSTRLSTLCESPKENPTGGRLLRTGLRDNHAQHRIHCVASEKEGIKNFSLFCNHITIIPTIKAILDSPDLQLDGFLGPGHVSMVIGDTSYRFIAEHYKKPL